ncbi:MAG: tetratricopeptide repeat protein [Pirellulales bacterium]|nr:tetratricopeptide repeat protein [Pirellulales bacterium]
MEQQLDTTVAAVLFPGNLPIEDAPEPLEETPDPGDDAPLACAGEQIALVGRLSGMSKREAVQLIRQHGGQATDKVEPSTTWIVVGENELPLPGSPLGATLDAILDEPTKAAIDAGELRLTGETHLWDRLGLVEAEQDIRRLYTPAMLADLLKVPVATIRRWHRRGLIRPAREVKRLPYFDFPEVAATRRLAELAAGGISLAALEKRLAQWSRYLPQCERPLAQLSLIAQGNHVLARQAEGLVDPAGQMFFDFAGGGQPPTGMADGASQMASVAIPSRPTQQPTPGAGEIPGNVRQSRFEAPLSGDEGEPDTESDHSRRTPQSWDPAEISAPPEVLLEMAAEMEDEDDLSAAGNLYRIVLAAQGPTADVNFALAEVLYRQSDLTAARERYAMAVELQEDFVEARANLGCVLLELGDRELAVAAFQGALRYHPEYPDVHFHLARALTELNRPAAARPHWLQFLKLAPESPWAEEARRQLGEV